MVDDAEAVVGSTQLGLASGLRHQLFTSLLGTSEHNDKNTEKMYEVWTKILKDNWSRVYNSKSLKGTASYFYDHTIVAPFDAD